MPLSPTSRTAPSSFLLALVSLRPMTSATARPARPAMPISSSITLRSPTESIRKAISPIESSKATTVTSETSAIWMPTERWASSRSTISPMTALMTAAPTAPSVT